MKNETAGIFGLVVLAIASIAALYVSLPLLLPEQKVAMDPNLKQQFESIVGDKEVLAIERGSGQYVIDTRDGYDMGYIRNKQ